jgi:predicted ATPase
VWSLRLEAVTIELFRNFVDNQRIVIEPDVTCLVGKNESGKTTILKALHRLKPANGTDITFDITTEYPRWRLARDRRSNPQLDRTQPVRAEFSLTSDDLAVFGEVLGVRIPPDSVCTAGRTYSNVQQVSLRCSVEQAAQIAASDSGLDSSDLSRLPIMENLAEVVSTAKAIAKEHRESGETARARSLTAFASLLEKYAGLVSGGGVTQELTTTLWNRLPSFFYFSNYDTLPGETNLTNLAAKISANTTLNARERTVVALLAHAGESPSDFLDANYDSRKAELQAASVDLSRQVFKYWRQNPDLAVIFDTDNRVIKTDPQGNETANRFLRIELRDGRHGDVETNFDTRSSGFQWFFSFFAAFSRYQDSTEDVVVLLDEPGTSLHGDAQIEFVEYIFNELGASKQTIYTTHSQHMVDPSRYEKLRAVYDRATRESPDLGVLVSLPSLSADRATILPIESALGYSVSQHLFIGSGQHLAVEGSSDFIFLQRMTEYFVSKSKQGLDPRLAMIPVGGADNMPAFVALLGRRLKVSALVDGSRSNTRLARIREAARHNGVPESAIVACSDVSGAPANADIEDMFSAAHYLRLYNWAFNTVLQVADLPATSEPILRKLLIVRGGPDFDHALPAHALTEHREDFFATLDPSTVTNFEALFTLLNATVQS